MNIVIDAYPILTQFKSCDYLSDLSENDRSEVLVQAFDCVCDSYDGKTSKAYLVLDLLKEKPAENEISAVHYHFNFLCKIIFDMLCCYLNIKYHSIPKIKTISLLNNIMLIKI